MNNGTEQIELSVVKGSTSGSFSLTEVGVNLAPDTSLEQWTEGLKAIKWFKTKLTIGLADYIAFGKKHFGDVEVDKCLEQLQFDIPMVKAAVAINTVPMEMRFPNLTGDHYVELAKADISKNKMVHWARVASEQSLTPSQLRISIPAGEVVDKAAAKALMTGVITIHGIRQQFDVWIKRVGGLEGIMKMEQDVIDEIRGELQAMITLGRELQESIEKVESA